jgi:hypothetical protein
VFLRLFGENAEKWAILEKFYAAERLTKLSLICSGPVYAKTVRRKLAKHI